MSPKGKERTTGNSSQTRMSGRGPQNAEPHADGRETSSPESLSPREGEALPGRNQNNEQPVKGSVQVSLSPNIIITSQNEKTIVDSGGKEITPQLPKDDNDVILENPTVKTPTAVTGEGEGDNRNITKGSNQERDEGDNNNPRAKEPWHDAFLELKATSLELKAIRERTDKLDKIEAATLTLTEQMAKSKIVGKTSALEAKVDDNVTQVSNLNEEIRSLKDKVEKQDQQITQLLKLKENYKRATQKSIGEMNDLIQVQKEQVDSFHGVSKRLKNDIMNDVEGKVDGLVKEMNHNKLKNQAYRNRQNLVITGLEEEVDKSPKKAATDFIETSLKVKDTEIEEAYRIGPAPTEGSSYCRPLVVKFTNFAQRNRVWKKRIDITAEQDDHKIRVQ